MTYNKLTQCPHFLLPHSSTSRNMSSSISFSVQNILLLMATFSVSVLNTHAENNAVTVHSSKQLHWCHTFRQTGDIAMYESCTCNNECETRRCQDDICVCRIDAHCPDGSKCINHISSPNQCAPLGLDIGDLCVQNGQCLSNRCQGGRCVCRVDGECPFGQKCYKPFFSPNYCSPTTLPLDHPCNKNSQCDSGLCEKGKCVCKYDHHCAGSKTCDNKLFGANECV